MWNNLLGWFHMPPHVGSLLVYTILHMSNNCKHHISYDVTFLHWYVLVFVQNVYFFSHHKNLKLPGHTNAEFNFHKMYFLIGMGLYPPRPCVNTWTPCPNLIATQEAMRNPLESWKGPGYFVKGDLAETIDLGRWASLLLVVPSFSSCPSWSWCGPSWSPFSLKRTYYCVVRNIPKEYYILIYV
jgi:hypothetical protein